MATARSPQFEARLPAQPPPEVLADVVPSPPLAEETSPFLLVIGTVFNGPLDLLLALIRKQDINIYDIPIAIITAQFLAYTDRFHAEDIESAADFILMSAQLCLIKSKMLLPRGPKLSVDGEEDPRRELVNMLLNHERFKQAAQMLGQTLQVEQSTLTNPGMREFVTTNPVEDDSRPVGPDGGTFDLVSVFRQCRIRAANGPAYQIDGDILTVSQMFEYLRRRLVIQDRPITLKSALGNSPSDRMLSTTFLALLEMTRLGAVVLRQDVLFGAIQIKKTSEFDCVMNDCTSSEPQWA